MVHTLADRFLQLIDASNKKQRPNAQDAANLLWALATMHHAAATDKLLDLVCGYFASLLQRPDARQRPTSQAVSNVMWALAVTKHTLKDGRLLDDFCMYMHSLLQSQDQRARPQAQEVANMLWAVAVTKHTMKDGRLLDDFCMYMHGLLHSQHQRAHPNAQDVANMLWALAELKHAPSGKLVSAMLDHSIALCQTPGLQPKPQNISNVFIACAELTLSVRPAQVEVLLKHLLGLPVSEVSYQAYSNVAWSLAVMSYLDISMFGAVLHQLTEKHSMSWEEPGIKGSSAQLTEAAGQQLHQASEWLKPVPGSDQMEAWSRLHSRLQKVAPKPQLVPTSLPGQDLLYSALATQTLPYKAQVACGMYWADAVLFPHDISASQVILVVERLEEYLTNLPSRVLGHAAFRLTMLERYGIVVTVPYKQGSGSVESMAGDIKAAVEAKTGLPLDYFRS